MAPATDLLVPAVQRQFASAMAAALVQAERQLRPALFAIGSTQLVGVTQNRRARISPYVSKTTIDPNVAVLRVDDATSGARLATLWNFAIHGVCYGPSNLKFSGDIMGRANS